MHSGGFELTKLTYTRLEDNLIRHRGDRYIHCSDTRHHRLTIIIGDRLTININRKTPTTAKIVRSTTYPTTWDTSFRADFLQKNTWEDPYNSNGVVLACGSQNISSRRDVSVSDIDVRRSACTYGSAVRILPAAEEKKKEFWHPSARSGGRNVSPHWPLHIHVSTRNSIFK